MAHEAKELIRKKKRGEVLEDEDEDEEEMKIEEEAPGEGGRYGTLLSDIKSKKRPALEKLPEVEEFKML
jgi:hypothetical protein